MFSVLTCKYGAILFDVEVMIGSEDQWNGTERQV